MQKVHDYLVATTVLRHAHVSKGKCHRAICQVHWVPYGAFASLVLQNLSYLDAVAQDEIYCCPLRVQKHSHRTVFRAALVCECKGASRQFTSGYARPERMQLSRAQGTRAALVRRAASSPKWLWLYRWPCRARHQSRDGWSLDEHVKVSESNLSCHISAAAVSRRSSRETWV